MKLNRYTFILMLLSFVTVIWGLNVIMIKYLSGVFPIIQLAAWRITIAAVCLLIFMYKKWKTEISTVTKKGWLWIFLSGLSSITLHQLLVAKGLQFTSGSTGSLILALNPLTTALLSMFILGDRFETRKFIGIGLGFFGVLLVVGHPSASNGNVMQGNFYVFLAMLAYVAGGLLIKQSLKYANVFVVTTFSHVAGAIMLLCFWMFQQAPSVTAVSPFGYGVMVFSGAVATALCTTWWNMAISEIGPSKTTLFLNVMPLSSLIFAAIFLKESIHWYHTVALLLIVSGIYLGLASKRKKKIDFAETTVREAGLS